MKIKADPLKSGINNCRNSKLLKGCRLLPEMKSLTGYAATVSGNVVKFHQNTKTLVSGQNKIYSCKCIYINIIWSIFGFSIRKLNLQNN